MKNQDFFKFICLIQKKDQFNTRLENDIRDCLNKILLEKLNSLILEINPYAKKFKMLADEHLKPDKCKEIAVQILSMKGQYAAPESEEIGVFIPNTDNQYSSKTPIYRNIILRDKDGKNFSINEMNPMYDPLHYPLMFPHGDVGYSYNCNWSSSEQNTTVLKHYQQIMQIRPSKPLYLFSRLYQEYVCDQYAKIEGWRLNYIKNNQKRIKSELYNGVMDFLNTHQQHCSKENSGVHQESTNNSANENIKLGKTHIVLPATFSGGPRWYQTKFLDAMNMVNALGPAQLIGTMTCNPKWPEVKELLLENENPFERIDVLCRVFRMKLRMCLDDIFKSHVFGFAIGKTYVIEFQKRGLPHAHILVILHKDDAPKGVEDFDKFFKAEIPDPIQEPKLYQAVSNHMLHLCKEPGCIENGKCRFGYKFDFCNETKQPPNGRVLWRRPKNERKIVKRRDGKLITFDNQDVVPYNPCMLLKYDCHMFWDICTTKFASLRYIFSYIFKGEDRIALKLSQQKAINDKIICDDNEIELYLSGRIITAEEAYWRIMQFPIVEISPPSEQLPVILPGEQQIILEGKQTEETLRDKLEKIDKNTNNKLEAFFELNKQRKLSGEIENDDLYYHDTPTFYTWQASSKYWKPRQRTYKNALTDIDTIGRLVFVPPRQKERHCLRMLLRAIPNATSYNDLMKVNTKTHDTFQEACAAHGLLDDDTQWHNTLEEAKIFYTPKKVREMFAFILAFSEVNEPHKLWEIHKEDLSIDFLRESTTSLNKEIEQWSLQDIDKFLKDFGRDAGLTDFITMPQLQEKQSLSQPGYSDKNYLMLASFADDIKLKANPEQKVVLDTIYSQVEKTTFDDKYNYHFIHASAGTGKTFIMNGIAGKTISHFKNFSAVIVVSSTAISAQQFRSEFLATTAHYTFKLPIHFLDPNTIRCGLSMQEIKSQRLKQAKVLIWDEILTARKECVEAVDDYFRELFCIDKPFGGLITVVAGDSRQTLPKIKGNHSRGAITQVTFKNSYLYNYFTVHNLTINMRLLMNAIINGSLYAEFILKIGEGRLPINNQQRIELPNTFLHYSKRQCDMILFVLWR